MKMKKTRYFTAVFTGNMVFFFFYALVVWALTSFNLTPYGKFVNTFFKGRTKEDARAFMEANRVVFDQMLRDASFFASVFITPFVALMVGLVVGAILYHDRKLATAWSFISVIPVSVLLFVKSSGEPLKFLYLGLLLAAAAAGGYLGSVAASKKYSEKDNAHP